MFRRELVRHRHTGDLYLLAVLPGWSSNGVGDILGVEGPLAVDADWRGIALPTRHWSDPDLGWARAQPWRTVALAWDDV